MNCQVSFCKPTIQAYRHFLGYIVKIKTTLVTWGGSVAYKLDACISQYKWLEQEV